ncbi:MAG TPA: SDR family NAD(P)-dependent oxidoreductase [Candidatus Pacearchaeota archaeon]|nr:SDR family NAD(P)-dependent oxidoreductase [Candidatus Pacearchaeota archaeon]HQI74530.1 SDR family NAD(P)-dependent oxidoreductase [Candidatus Pacearchaeota archaeon]
MKGNFSWPKNGLKFAHLIHPMNSAYDDFSRAFPLLKKIFYIFSLIYESSFFRILYRKICKKELKGKPIDVFETFLKRNMHKIPPFAFRCQIDGSKKVVGWIIAIPVMARNLLNPNPKYKIPAMKKIIQALKLAKFLGVKVVSLGALTSVVSDGGKDLVGVVKGITIINGNWLTAYATKNLPLIACEKKGIDLKGKKIAIVGATGSIGSAVSKMLAKDGYDLICVARKLESLEELKKDIKNAIPESKESSIFVSNDIMSIKEASLVIVATSSGDSIVKPEHLADGAVVYDITWPRNTSIEIVKQRPDVLIIDGGVLFTPHIDYRFNLEPTPKYIHACISNAILMAYEGRQEDQVGKVDMKGAEREGTSFKKNRELIKFADFTSFGKKIEWAKLNA